MNPVFFHNSCSPIASPSCAIHPEKSFCEHALAFLKIGEGDYCVGWGPFKAKSTPPEGDECAFYCNNFELTDPYPWKYPTQVSHFTHLGDLESPLQTWGLQWEKKLNKERFKEIFDLIKKGIKLGDFQKVVPVFTLRGHCEVLPVGFPQLVRGAHGFFSYGWLEGGSGFSGFSPELLLSWDGQKIETMALAGTASVDEESTFLLDAKEKKEHAFVVDTLKRALGGFGHLEVGERELVRMGDLLHFRTLFSLAVEGVLDMNDFIRLLHPTPALGVLPQGPYQMESLIQWRKAMGVPSSFGAPFGLYWRGKLHLIVAIRGLFWQGKELFLPSGCGVIAASEFEREWRELHKKRSETLRCFGVEMAL